MFHVEQNLKNQPSHCLVCDNKEFTKLFDLKDYFLSQESFSVYQCNHCGLGTTHPSPEPENLGRYYETNDYISHSGESRDLFSKVYQLVRKYTHARKYQLLRKYSSAGTLLDIGCATGEFLAYCSSKQMQVKGIEPSEKARNIAVNRYHLEVFPEAQIDQFEAESFGIITMWHVLEHVPDINLRMKDISRLLSNDGVAMIALPNYLSKDARHYKQYWAAWDVPRHLHHFNRKSFGKLANNHGFKVIGVLPMYFDSFYVSMLSEKYKSGNTSLIRAFFQGLRSNLSAVSGQHEFSSLIYIIKKIV